MATRCVGTVRVAVTNTHRDWPVIRHVQIKHHGCLRGAVGTTRLSLQRFGAATTGGAGAALAAAALGAWWRDGLRKRVVVAVVNRECLPVEGRVRAEERLANEWVQRVSAELGMVTW